MPEVYHFDECLIKKITSGTIEERMDYYVTDVTVSARKTFKDITDEDGEVIKRFQTGKSAELSIGCLFGTSGINITDGNNIKIYHGNALGTTTYQMGSCYISDEGWAHSENDLIKHDVKILGRNFGTI